MNHINEFAFRRTWGPKPNYPKVIDYVPPEDKFIVIAGPCSVESETQINEIAKIVADNGATHLRGGVFRAGTYPGQNFGYVDEKLIEAYSSAAQKNGLKNIIEVLDYSPTSIQMVSQYADCFQVGCRQMQNYTLLKKVSEYGKTIFLKRHPGSTLDEWLGSAEHILNFGPNGFTELFLIERGSSNHLNHVRWDLSISMIPAVQAITNIPIICDASHGTGRRDLVKPMALAGVAAGADGILLEVHTDPDKSLSDKDQAISPDQFKNIMKTVSKVRASIYF